MSILNELFGSIFNKLFRSTLEIKEATDFNPENVGLMEVNEVTYGLSYQDNGNGNSKVKLLISPSYQSKTYEWDTGINVENKYKGQLSLTLVEDFGEIDKIGIVFPEEGLNRRKKYERLSFNVYEVSHSVDKVSVKYFSTAKLQTNVNDYNDGNLDNRYYFPKVVKTSKGLIVVAHNSKNQQLIAWRLKPDENGQLKPLPGSKLIIERKLLKFDNLGQLAFSENAMLYSQEKEIIIEGEAEKQTSIFSFNIEELAKKLRDGNQINECLLANRACRINTVPYVISRGEISFMQYVTNQKGKDLIAFLIKDLPSKEQSFLSFATVSNQSSEVQSDFPVYKFTDPIEQLYVKGNGHDGFVVTAVSGENIITFNINSLFHPSDATFIPVSSIKSLSDFAGIINGRLTPEIISSSTVEPITTEEITERPSSAIPTVASSSTKITKTTTGTGSETSTATIASSSVTTLQITTEPTKVTIPSTPYVVTTRVTTPADISSKPTQTIPSSTEYERSTAPSSSTTTYLPQPTFSPPTPRAIKGRSSNTEAIAKGTVGGAVAVVGLVALGIFIYKFIQRRRRCRYTSPVLELDSFSSRASSNPELDTQSISPTNSHGSVSIEMDEFQPPSIRASDKEEGTQETPLNSVSVDELLPPSISAFDKGVGTKETPLNSMLVRDISPASSSSLEDSPSPAPS